jgi:hypothetical protein
MGNGLLIEVAKVPQGFAGHQLVGVDNSKPSSSHIPRFSDVGKLFTLSNIDSDHAPLSAMVLIIMTLIFRMGFDTELSKGGMQNSGKPSVFR